MYFKQFFPQSLSMIHMITSQLQRERSYQWQVLQTEDVGGDKLEIKNAHIHPHPINFSIYTANINHT
jgi:hypothetical protein